MKKVFCVWEKDQVNLLKYYLFFEYVTIKKLKGIHIISKNVLHFLWELCLDVFILCIKKVVWSNGGLIAVSTSANDFVRKDKSYM